MEIKEKLLEKSKEAFLMAIEVYNKPSIKYRVEGFSFFICNAWELMLKSHLIKTEGERSIFYLDNPTRTISLEKCIQKVFTNDKDPLRKNIEKIVELRNTSTHFITEEYEMVYIPLFQACVFNFIEKMGAFHAVDMTDIIPQNFLTLAVSYKTLDYEEIRAKYPPEIAERLVAINENLLPEISGNNNHFAITVRHDYYITKDKDKATTIVKIDNTAEASVKVLKVYKNPNDTHKFNCKTACNEIKRRLTKLGITWQFNRTHFQLFCKYYSLKDKEEFCYVSKIYSENQYSYSLRTIEFIVDEIKKDPENIIQNLKKSVKK